MTLVPAHIIEKDIVLLDLTNLTGPIIFNDDVRLYFGTDRDAYFVWNGTTNKLELWVGGRKKVQWS